MVFFGWACGVHRERREKKKKEKEMIMGVVYRKKRVAKNF